MIIWVFILILGAIYFVIMGIFQPEDTIRVHLDIEPSFSYSRKTRAGVSAPVSILRKISSLINAPFLNTGYFRNLNNKLEFLKSPLGAAEVLLFKELFMALAALSVYVLFSPTYALVAAVLGFLLPDIIITRKVQAKKEAIIKFFPETVDLLDLCIGAGLDFLSSVRWIIEKSHSNPFIEQLEMVTHEIEVGKNRVEALKAMAGRLNIPDVSSFTRTIIQAERMGTSIEEALRNLSEDTRNSRFQRGERYAIKASLKILVPLLFCILPVIMIVVAGPIIIKFTQGGLIPGGSGF